MINIVHIDTHFNDKRGISALEIKLKSLGNGSPKITGHPLVATISAAFFKTTLLTDVGQSLSIEVNPKRSDIVDLTINMRDSDLTFGDIAKFIEALQKALDETNINF